MTTTDLRTKTRALHLVDIENLCGDPNASEAVAHAVLDDYLRVAHWQEHDLVMIASNPGLALRYAWRLPVDCRIHTASGPDGADLALLAQAAPDFVARRAGRLVIGSGDGGFIPRALAARDLGVGVLVVARPGSVHGGWRAHGFPVVPLTTAQRQAA